MKKRSDDKPRLCFTQAHYAALRQPAKSTFHRQLLKSIRRKADMYLQQEDVAVDQTAHVSNSTGQRGCLRVYPGSHRLGRVPQTSEQIDSELLREYPLEKSTVVECEPGDVVFFHYFTLPAFLPFRRIGQSI